MDGGSDFPNKRSQILPEKKDHLGPRGLQKSRKHCSMRVLVRSRKRAGRSSEEDRPLDNFGMLKTKPLYRRPMIISPKKVIDVTDSYRKCCINGRKMISSMERFRESQYTEKDENGDTELRSRQVVKISRGTVQNCLFVYTKVDRISSMERKI
ncbi:hypothetical protein KIN20_009222 [Parelaphostrongylus tenuis]|uniref:Uncharacterized protein n=1 Tax=Parelaphostrongylus tenuis TaxID=148309 RepID=A0AAD5M612_PARTN|nr:hypothetical protein KIN20_009222 [Parelaphostrongylus tenuis]